MVFDEETYSELRNLTVLSELTSKVHSSCRTHFNSLQLTSNYVKSIRALKYTWSRYVPVVDTD